MCDLCGRPISSQSPYERPDDNYPYEAQARARRHFACHNQFLSKRAAEEQARIATLTPEKREEEEAERFNASDTVDPRTHNPELNVYRPAPGELPFEKIQQAGGISKVIKPIDPLANLPQPTAAQDAEADRQSKETEERVRQEFADYQASLKESPETQD